MRAIVPLVLLTSLSLASCKSTGSKLQSEELPAVEAAGSGQRLEPWVEEALSFSHRQTLSMIRSIGVDNPKIPRSAMPDAGIRFEAPVDAKGVLGWTTGFFPGSLWFLHEYLREHGTSESADEMLRYAKVFTSKLEPVQNLTNDHDVGFVMYCSYGQGYRITQDASYRAILLKTAESLATRFNPKVGCTKSWDWWGDRNKDFPVIMDNMMNLELLFWASQTGQSPKLKDIADRHAHSTLTNHFRPDHSAFHMVVYDPATGAVKRRQNYQGYDDDSVWARGHGWALYGFTFSYRETKRPEYLQRARQLADLLYSHPNMPEDLVPYWDFTDPRIPNVARDASAAALYASALYELSLYVDQQEAGRYRELADRTLRSLASDRYRETVVGGNHGFILKHSVGSLNDKLMFEIDVPLNYADYYFLEALLRKVKLERGQSIF
jgi:hypothetical protein